MRSRERKIRKIPGEREQEERKKGKKEGDEMTTGRGGMRLQERRERGRWEAQERESRDRGSNRETKLEFQAEEDEIPRERKREIKRGE